MDKALPNRQSGSAADSLAYKIMKATHYEAWQSTAVVSWNFAGRHQHTWDKNRSYARVEWKKYVVIFDIGTKSGRAWKDGEEITGEKLKKLVDKAWGYWANDSFWLNPFAKLFDEGVERFYVLTDDGKDALLVTYSSGGLTPGDSYLWITDSTGLPVKVKMWVSILPFKGVPVSWEGWETLATGAKVAGQHKIAFINLRLSDINAAYHLEDISERDPFEDL